MATTTEVDRPLTSGGIAIIVVNTVFTILAIIAVIGRFYTRRITRKPYVIDDFFIAAGLIFTIATVGIGYSLVLDGGAGRHMNLNPDPLAYNPQDATLDEIAMAAKLFVPAPLLWGFATSCIKLSILYWYISIFTISKLRKAVYVVIGVTMALLVAILLECFLLCRPFRYTWDKTITGVCGDSTKAYLSVAIVNLAIDLSIVALPMPVLWNLKMAPKKKGVVTGILCLGLVICIFTAIRIKSVLDLDPLDFTYTVVPDTIYGGLEIELGTINVCLPILRPLFSKWFGRNSAFSTTWGSKQSETDTSDTRNFSKSQELNSKRFQRLHDRSDDTYPLEDMTTTINAGSDLKNQGPQSLPGVVYVQNDIRMHSTVK